MLLRSLSLLLIISTYLIACTNPNKAKEIINTWQVIDIQIQRPSEDSSAYLSEPSPNPNSQAHFRQHNIKYTFQADSSYQVHHGKLSDQGTWALSQDHMVLLLKSALHPDDNAEFLIQRFTAYQMVLVSEQDGVQEILTLEANN